MAARQTSTQGGVKQKSQSVSSTPGKLLTYKKIIEEYLPKYFPNLANVPDVTYVMMSTLLHESGGELWFSKNFKGTDLGKSQNNSLLNDAKSAHHSPQTTENSSIVRVFWNHPLIVTIRNNPTSTLQQLKAINEGRVAHGLMGVMGLYFIAGTRDHETFFKAYGNSKIVSDLGLVVDITSAERISSKLFGTDDEASWRKAIGAGMAIMNSHIMVRKQKGLSYYDALYSAAGSYVGSDTAKDANKYSGADRKYEIFSKNKFDSLLAEAGVFKSGYSGTDMGKVVASNKTENKQTAAPTTTSTPADREVPTGCA